MKFKKRKLKNGITVLFEEREIPIVCYSISNPFGGAHETTEIKGVAHLFEHLLFTGTKTRSQEDIAGEVEKRGGVINAFTAQDVTTFWCKLPSEHLDIAMDILHDILKNPTFDQEKIEKEKRVVLEEIKMFHDDPERRVYEIIESALYEGPFGEGILGTAKTVKSLTRDKIIQTFSDCYSPEKFIVTVVGKADFHHICKRLESEFSPKNKTYSAIPISKKQGNVIEERKGIDQTQFIWATHTALEENKQYALEILNTYLANGMSSKLWLEIREKHGLAYTIRGSIEREKSYGYYSIYVGTTKEAVEKVKETILQELKKVDKMSEQDLTKSREKLIGLRKVATEESINTMQKLIFEEISTGKAEKYYDYEQALKKINLSNIKSLAKELLKDYSTAVVLPKNE